MQRKEKKNLLNMIRCKFVKPSHFDKVVVKKTYIIKQAIDINYQRHVFERLFLFYL